MADSDLVSVVEILLEVTQQQEDLLCSLAEDGGYNFIGDDRLQKARKRIDELRRQEKEEE